MRVDLVNAEVLNMARISRWSRGEPASGDNGGKNWVKPLTRMPASSCKSQKSNTILNLDPSQFSFNSLLQKFRSVLIDFYEFLRNKHRRSHLLSFFFEEVFLSLQTAFATPDQMSLQSSE